MQSLLSGPELEFHQLVVAHTGRTMWGLSSFLLLWNLHTLSLRDNQITDTGASVPYYSVGPYHLGSPL